MSLRVFFGGSFAPPHIGHHQLLQRLLREPGVEHVHLIPTGVNPLKNAKKIFDRAGRRALVDAWIETLRRDHQELAQKLVLETFELESEKPSYTISSIRRLCEQHPDAQWVLALGADNLLQLPQWKDVSDLLASLEAVWVFARGGYSLSPQDIPLELRECCSWRLFPDSFEWISSSELREEADILSDATQAKLRPFLLDNVFAVLSGLLPQKSRIE